MKERNRRVVKKFIKTVYFMGRNKRAVKNKFEPLVNHMRDLGDEDLKKHSHYGKKCHLHVPFYS